MLNKAKAIAIECKVPTYNLVHQVIRTGRAKERGEFISLVKRPHNLTVLKVLCLDEWGWEAKLEAALQAFAQTDEGEDAWAAYIATENLLGNPDALAAFPDDTFTRDQANKLISALRFQKLAIEDDQGTHFRLVLRSNDGCLRWRIWNFESGAGESIKRYLC